LACIFRKRRFKGLIKAEHVAAHGQVHARAEGPPFPGNDNRAYGIVATGTREGIDKFVAHLDREAVKLVGSVEGQ
jgi:hypothetical protein